MRYTDRHKAERWGRRAEALACWSLRLKGYSILARRQRTPVGEIDIVARHGSVLAIVEVKARRSSEDAHSALAARQRARLARAAAWLVGNTSGYANLSIRFDFIVIVPWRWPRHIADAWRDGE